MSRRRTEEPKYNYLECSLYSFHHLAHKVIRQASAVTVFDLACRFLHFLICVMQTPNSTNSLCGYKIVTGQPSDRLGEDFSENYKDFTER